MNEYLRAGPSAGGPTESNGEVPPHNPPSCQRERGGIIPRIIVCLLSVGLLVLSGAVRAQSTPGERVVKDLKGRVTSRTTTTTPEGVHRTLFGYVSDSEKPSNIIDEDLNRLGRVSRRVEQRFDAQGRISEKVEVRFEESGKGTGSRTRYSYDPSGHRSESSTPVK